MSVGNVDKNAVIWGTGIGVTEHLLSVGPRNLIDFKQYFHSKKEASTHIQTLVKHQPLKVFKGTAPYLFGAAVGHIGLFSCLEKSKQTPSSTNLQHAGWGMLGRLSHDVCITPFDTVRMRANVSGVSVVDAYKQLIRTQSYAGLFKGLPSTLAMNAPAGAAEFVTMNYLSNTFGSDGMKPYMWAFAAGLVSSIIVSPLDTIRTCIQCRGVEVESRAQFHTHQSVTDIVRHVYAKRGWTGFFRGIGLRCLSTTLTFGMYEYLRRRWNLEVDDFKD